MTAPLLASLLLLAAVQETWMSRDGRAITLPAPWRKLAATELASDLERARIEALKPALGGETRTITRAGIEVSTWARALEGADAVFVTGPGASRYFVRVFEAAPDFAPPPLPGAPAREIFRLAARGRSLTVTTHGAAPEPASRDELLRALELGFGTTETQAPERSWWWLALLPFGLAGFLFARTRRPRTR